MVIVWIPAMTQCVTILLFILSSVQIWAETVYMDRYGDCFHNGPWEIEDNTFIIRAQGGEPYDTLNCQMTFKSEQNDRLCISFRSFNINRCDVKVSAYSSKDASGVAMGTYSCQSQDPEMICSEGKYLTVIMRKQELSHDGYDFTLEIREFSHRDAFTEGIDSFIVSISLIVGVIVGVIVIVIITAVVIVCCCCKNKPNMFMFRQKSSASRSTAYTDVPVQPSAPPLPPDEPPAYSDHPPPYSVSDNSQSPTAPVEDDDWEQTYDVKTKKLQERLQQFDERNRAVLQLLQKIESAKKDKDAKPSLEALEGQLEGALTNIKELEKEMHETQTEVNQKLGRKSSGPEKRKALEPEEQEMAYELKSQLLKNVEIQNQKLKTEFTLHEKMAESRLLSQQNKRLNEDVTLSRANSMRLIKVFERKAREADNKLKEMTIELKRSQDLAEKYRNLYELERRKNTKEGDHLPPVVDDGQKLPDKESSYTFLGGNTRINDIIRKNEVLVEENTDQKREIRRLKEDNNRLIRQTKLAMQDRDQMLHKLETSESNRRNLLKRLEKEKDQHQTLSRSLTRQASDWILLKKQIAQFDEEYRWSQVIGMWLKSVRGRGRLTFPPLAPETLQDMVAHDPTVLENPSDQEDK